MKKYISTCLLISIFSINSYAFDKSGYYTVNNENWIANTTPLGDVFVCSKCDGQTQIQISYGPEIPKDSPIKSFSDLNGIINTEITKKEFIKGNLEESMPINGFKVEVKRAEETKISGVKAIQYLAEVTFPQGYVGMENGFITIHKNRILRISINYFPDASKSDFKKIDSFLSSLKLK